MVNVGDRQSLVSIYEQVYNLDKDGKTPAAPRMLVDIARCALIAEGLGLEEIYMIEQTIKEELGVERKGLEE
jgi:hypothetical protein